MTKTSIGFIDYLVIGLATLALLIFAVPQDVRAESPPSLPGPQLSIEASLDESLFTQEQICLDQGCAFVFGPEQSSDAYYIKRSHEQDQEEDLSLLGHVSYETNFLRIESPSGLENEGVPLDEAALVEALDVLIEDDVSDIKPVLLQTFEGWADGSSRSVLTVTPYEPSKERELQKEKNRLFECYYAEYEQKGDWLLLIAGGDSVFNREYCWSGHLMHSHFAYFLLTHMDEIPTSYLAGLILMLLIVVGFIYRLIRKGEFWLFLKPNKTKIIIVIGYIGMIVADTILFYHGVFYGRPVIDYLVEIYLLTCVIGYAMYRRRIKRTTN